MALGSVDCGTLSRETQLSWSVCDELSHAVNHGRTRRGDGRRIVREHLREQGLRRIKAFIVAYHGDNQYEVARLGYNGYFDISYPTRRHFLVETVATRFTTKGSFRLWVRQVGTRMITLNSGFTETWPVYRESVLGELWQAVRKARAGYETRQAAKELLKFLIFADVFREETGVQLTDHQVFALLKL